MNAIIEQLKIEDRNRRTADQKRYHNLIDQGELAGDEVLELRALLERLGKSAVELQLDHNVVEEAKRMEQAIRDGHGLDEKIVAMWQTLLDHNTETDRIIAERAKAKNRISDEHHRLQSARFASQDAWHNLQKLVNQHPDLLGPRHPAIVNETPDPHRRIPSGGAIGNLRHAG